MSEVLERVIAEQQKEIDRLRLMEKHNIEAWQRENAKVENLAMWAFSVLNHPESPECHFELKKAVMAMGFARDANTAPVNAMTMMNKEQENAMNLESKLPPMPTVTFLSANDVAKELLPGSDFDTANAFAVSHVSAAIENLAEWKHLNGKDARIDLDAVVREVREMGIRIFWWTDGGNGLKLP